MTIRPPIIDNTTICPVLIPLSSAVASASAVVGCVSAIASTLLPSTSDFEFATAEATCSAAEKGLRVLVFTVGKMTNRVTSRLEDKGIIYCIEDVKKV